MSESPTIRIDLSSPVPAYRQIAGGLRTMLVTGSFRAGDLLPTIRQLAVDLGIHPNTVAEAYRVLADEGWVDLRRRRGATVLARSAPTPDAEAPRVFMRRIEDLLAEALAAGVRREDLAAGLRGLAEQMLGGEDGGR